MRACVCADRDIQYCTKIASRAISITTCANPSSRTNSGNPWELGMVDSRGHRQKMLEPDTSKWNQQKQQDTSKWNRQPENTETYKINLVLEDSHFDAHTQPIMTVRVFKTTSKDWNVMYPGARDTGKVQNDWKINYEWIDNGYGALNVRLARTHVLITHLDATWM